MVTTRYLLAAILSWSGMRVESMTCLSGEQELKLHNPKVHGWVVQLRANGHTVEVRRSVGHFPLRFTFRVDGRPVLSISRLWATFHSQLTT
jgi:hypothetical protein